MSAEKYPSSYTAEQPLEYDEKATATSYAKLLQGLRQVDPDVAHGLEVAKGRDAAEHRPIWYGKEDDNGDISRGRSGSQQLGYLWEYYQSFSAGERSQHGIQATGHAANDQERAGVAEYIASALCGPADQARREGILYSAAQLDAQQRDLLHPDLFRKHAATVSEVSKLDLQSSAEWMAHGFKTDEFYCVSNWMNKVAHEYDSWRQSKESYQLPELPKDKGQWEDEYRAERRTKGDYEAALENSYRQSVNAALPGRFEAQEPKPDWRNIDWETYSPSAEAKKTLAWKQLDDPEAMSHFGEFVKGLHHTEALRLCEHMAGECGSNDGNMYQGPGRAYGLAYANAHDPGWKGGRVPVRPSTARGDVPKGPSPSQGTPVLPRRHPDRNAVVGRRSPGNAATHDHPVRGLRGIREGIPSTGQHRLRLHDSHVVENRGLRGHPGRKQGPGTVQRDRRRVPEHRVK